MHAQLDAELRQEELDFISTARRRAVRTKRTLDFSLQLRLTGLAYSQMATKDHYRHMLPPTKPTPKSRRPKTAAPAPPTRRGSHTPRVVSSSPRSARLRAAPRPRTSHGASSHKRADKPRRLRSSRQKRSARRRPSTSHGVLQAAGRSQSPTHEPNVLQVRAPDEPAPANEPQSARVRRATERRVSGSQSARKHRPVRTPEPSSPPSSALVEHGAWRAELEQQGVVEVPLAMQLHSRRSTQRRLQRPQTASSVTSPRVLGGKFSLAARDDMLCPTPPDSGSSLSLTTSRRSTRSLVAYRQKAASSRADPEADVAETPGPGHYHVNKPPPDTMQARTSRSESFLGTAPFVSGVVARSLVGTTKESRGTAQYELMRSNAGSDSYSSAPTSWTAAGLKRGGGVNLASQPARDKPVPGTSPDDPAELPGPADYVVGEHMRVSETPTPLSGKPGVSMSRTGRQHGRAKDLLVIQEEPGPSSYDVEAAIKSVQSQISSVVFPKAPRKMDMGDKQAQEDAKWRGFDPELATVGISSASESDEAETAREDRLLRAMHYDPVLVMSAGEGHGDIEVERILANRKARKQRRRQRRLRKRPLVFQNAVKASQLTPEARAERQEERAAEHSARIKAALRRADMVAEYNRQHKESQVSNYRYRIEQRRLAYRAQAQWLGMFRAHRFASVIKVRYDTLLLEQKQQVAAAKIQTWWRLRMEKLHQENPRAAQLHRAVKRGRFMFVAKVLARKKREAALLIQRFLLDSEREASTFSGILNRFRFLIVRIQRRVRRYLLVTRARTAMVALQLQRYEKRHTSIRRVVLQVLLTERARRMRTVRSHVEHEPTTLQGRYITAIEPSSFVNLPLSHLSRLIERMQRLEALADSDDTSTANTSVLDTHAVNKVASQLQRELRLEYYTKLDAHEASLHSSLASVMPYDKYNREMARQELTGHSKVLAEERSRLIRDNPVPVNRVILKPHELKDAMRRCYEEQFWRLHSALHKEFAKSNAGVALSRVKTAVTAAKVLADPLVDGEAAPTDKAHHRVRGRRRPSRSEPSGAVSSANQSSEHASRRAAARFQVKLAHAKFNPTAAVRKWKDNVQKRKELRETEQQGLQIVAERIDP